MEDRVQRIIDARAEKKVGTRGRDPTGRVMQPNHNQADKMRSLFAVGAQARQGREDMNPMWHNFPTRCVQPIKSVEEMQKLLKFHGQSDNVMVVRYWQEGCTACNAIDKVFEFVCHDQRQKLTKLFFFDVQKEALPELTSGMLRYPQIKAFSAGQWSDLDFKPPQDFRESVYNQVEREVHQAAKRGQPVTALQAEEMYYSIAGPATTLILEESILSFYNRAQTRLHNYWKQISVRRSWYFKKYIEPLGPSLEEQAAETGTDVTEYSAFGETILPTVTSPAAAPVDIPNAEPNLLGTG